MSTIEKIRKHIRNVPIDGLFTSRDLLKYGNRNSVDTAVYKLKRTRELIAVARGVFRRPERKKPVTVLEVATAKAESFGRKIITHASVLLNKLGLPFNGNSSKIVFATGSKSSSFKFGSQRIYFHGTSTKNFSLGESKLGQIIRALCHLGKRFTTQKAIDSATRHLTRTERTELSMHYKIMPSWLWRYFHCWVPA